MSVHSAPRGPGGRLHAQRAASVLGGPGPVPSPRARGDGTGPRGGPWGVKREKREEVTARVLGLVPRGLPFV